MFLSSIYSLETMDIRCFQHCRRDKNILCFTVMMQCPLCGQDMTKTPMRIPPYILTSPFVSASDTQCCFLIKPTVGSFLYDFTNQSNLHIGIVNSNGKVYEFDEHGVSVGNANWMCCLKVELFEEAGSLVAIWDAALEKFKNNELWTSEFYDEKKHNCYDFVLAFAVEFGLHRYCPSLLDRGHFCEEMIVTKTAKAGQYISLYREIVRCGFVVQNCT